MKKHNDKMEQPKVEKLEEETGFEIVELDDAMLDDVRGGAEPFAAPPTNGVQCFCS